MAEAVSTKLKKNYCRTDTFYSPKPGRFSLISGVFKRNMKFFPKLSNFPLLSRILKNVWTRSCTYFLIMYIQYTYNILFLRLAIAFSIQTLQFLLTFMVIIVNRFERYFATYRQALAKFPLSLKISLIRHLFTKWRKFKSWYNQQLLNGYCHSKILHNNYHLKF